MALSISLINHTIGATSYLWNFGDGTTSTLKSPSHTYSQAGAYLVSLTVTGPGGAATTVRVATVSGDIGLVEFVATSALDVLTTSDGDQIILP